MLISHQMVKNFLYALGAIKNVGYEAISKIVEEEKKMENLKIYLIL